MTIPTLEGTDAISELMTKTMYQTLLALKSEGLLTQEAADQFSDQHVALASPYARGYFSEILRRIFKKKEPYKETNFSILICKVVNTEKLP